MMFPKFQFDRESLTVASTNYKLYCLRIFLVCLQYIISVFSYIKENFHEPIFMGVESCQND